MAVLGSWDKARSNRELAALLIAPKLPDVAMLDFGHLADMIAIGRRAAEDAVAQHHNLLRV